MPTNAAAYMREYMRAYRRTGRDTKAGLTRSRYRQRTERPFVGCDGEGVTLENGYHAYNLLRVGDKVLRPKSGNVRLTSWECLEFLTSLDTDVEYVGYFFDYDVTKILEDLPWKLLDRLMHRNKRTGLNGQLFPVDYLEWQVDYLPGKEFKVRRKISQTETDTVWSKWLVVNDVGSFFQCSFLSALEKWRVGTTEERRQIKEGKLQRASFSTMASGEIESYNALEIVLLQELMERFRDACQDAGYVPRKWQGPGLLAESMLRRHGVATSKDTSLLNDERFTSLIVAAIAAYYGGRFEVAAVGPVTGPVFQYDINSAYPDAMMVVPCLMHGGWEHVESPDPSVLAGLVRPSGIQGETFGIMFGSFTSRVSFPLWYGLPLRTQQGSILFPASGRGWYWSFEIDASVHQSFETEEMWLYTRRCNCQPLAFVEEVYRQRQALGKDGPGIVLKLGLNSLYGKTVQSVGVPKYANPIWGSFITAYPRMSIQDFIHSSVDCPQGTCGRDIIMIATDSVASTMERPDYPDSNDLGGWSVERHPHGVFIVQPGVYFGSSGKPNKTRGVPRTVVDAYEHVFRAAFNTMCETGELSDGDVSVPQTIFCGIRYALHRHNLKLLGQWVEFGEDGSKGKSVSFDWTSKRVLSPALGPSGNRTHIMTFPYKGGTDWASVPYSKDIGGLLAREEMRLAFEGQPDWTGIIVEED